MSILVPGIVKIGLGNVNTSCSGFYRKVICEKSKNGTIRVSLPVLDVLMLHREANALPLLFEVSTDCIRSSALGKMNRSIDFFYSLSYNALFRVGRFVISTQCYADCSFIPQ